MEITAYQEVVRRIIKGSTVMRGVYSLDKKYFTANIKKFTYHIETHIQRKTDFSSNLPVGKCAFK